ncbi:MAG: hypothetical protein IT479_03630 [Xanthomonadales bacterium]|nr:hypothetical protein [Xanthomonadales bacterium]MCC6592342.1 hypothetical protein [Xanthomonadales bacterium]MCE7930191.1 hypothetical protein [Xanthomonadales bacterium PRO6]
MNRHLIVPLVLADALAAGMLALGLGALLLPEVAPFAAVAAADLALPLTVVGALGVVGCAILLWRWFLASLRERGR